MPASDVCDKNLQVQNWSQSYMNKSRIQTIYNNNNNWTYLYRIAASVLREKTAINAGPVKKK